MKIKYTDETTLSHASGVSYTPGVGYNPNRDRKTGQFTYGHHDAPYERIAPSYSKETHDTGSGSHQYTYNTSYGSPSSSNTSSSSNTQNVNLKDIKTLAVASSSAGREIAKTADLFTKPKQGKRIDVSNMTDDDLRAILNRERMEREYNNYFNPPQVNKGAEVVKGLGNFISTSGTIALTALQAVEIIRGFTGH